MDYGCSLAAVPPTFIDWKWDGARYQWERGADAEGGEEGEEGIFRVSKHGPPSIFYSIFFLLYRIPHPFRVGHYTRFAFCFI